MKKATLFMLLFIVSLTLVACDNHDIDDAENVWYTAEEQLAGRIDLIEENNQLKVTENITRETIRSDGELLGTLNRTTTFDYQQDPFYVYRTEEQMLFDYLYIQREDKFHSILMNQTSHDDHKTFALVQGEVDRDSMAFDRITKFDQLIEQSIIQKIDDDHFTMDINLGTAFSIEETYFGRIIYPNYKPDDDFSDFELSIDIYFDEGYTIDVEIIFPLKIEYVTYLISTEVVPTAFEPIDIYEDDNIIRLETSMDDAPLISVGESYYISQYASMLYYRIYLEEGHYETVNHHSYNALGQVYDASKTSIDANVRVVSAVSLQDQFTNHIFIQQPGYYYLQYWLMESPLNSFSIERIDDQTSVDEDIITISENGTQTFMLSDNNDYQAFMYSVDGEDLLTVSTDQEGLFVYYVYGNAYRKSAIDGSITFDADGQPFYIAAENETTMNVSIDILNGN